MDSEGFPLSFGLIKVFSKSLDREVAHTVIGKTGKYYALLQNGEYYVKIQKKVGEDEYKELHSSEVFEVKEGYVGKEFIV